MIKYFAHSALLLVLAGLLASCGELEEPSGNDGPASQPGNVRVGEDGTRYIDNAIMPPSILMSEAARNGLLPPTEGPGSAQSEPQPEPATMAEQREIMTARLQPRVERMRELYPVDIEETMIDGVSVAIITPRGGVPEHNQNRIMLNVPGGGFVTGIRPNGLFISIPVASLGQMKVVTALYRQGPEHRFPAATEDFMRVYDWALQDHDPESIGMFGCSAGGVLVAQTIAAAILSGKPAPGVAGIYCAGATARFDGDSSAWSQLLRNGGSENNVNIIATGEDGYLSEVDTSLPEVSPVNDLELLARFPPTILATGTRDFAMSQAAFTHKEMVKVGLESDLLIYDGMGHGFMTNPDLPESRDLYEITVSFYDNHLAP